MKRQTQRSRRLLKRAVSLYDTEVLRWCCVVESAMRDLRGETSGMFLSARAKERLLNWKVWAMRRHVQPKDLLKLILDWVQRRTNGRWRGRMFGFRIASMTGAKARAEIMTRFRRAREIHCPEAITVGPRLRWHHKDALDKYRRAVRKTREKRNLPRKAFRGSGVERGWSWPV